MSRRRERVKKQATRRVVRPPRTAAVLRRRLLTLLRRFGWQTALAVAALHLLLGLLTFAPQPHTGGDNAAYIALGRSLIESGTYTEVWDPVSAPHTKYPPVFPGVLALAMLAGLRSWVQLKFVVLGMSAAAVAFTYLWIRARRRPLLALGVALVMALAPGVLNEARWILSDVPFWAFTMLALWSYERLRPGEWRWFALAAVATLLAYFTRSAGLPLVLAALAFLAWRRSWKQLAALAVIVGVPAVLWIMRARAFGPSGYVSEFWLLDPYAPQLGRAGISDMLQRVVRNDWKYMSIHMPMLLAMRTGGLLVLISIAAFLLAVYGWIARLGRARVAEFFVPLYVGLIFIWPDVWSGERFLLPLLPLLLYYAGDALVRITRRAQQRLDFVVPGAAAALLLLVALPGTIDAARTGRECVGLYRGGERYPCLGSPVWDDFFAIADAARAALPEGAVVINRKPRLFYGIGGVRGSIYPFAADPASFFATADSVGARYVVLDRMGTGDAYLVPVILRKPAAFCLMHARPATGTVLMGILPGHAEAPDLGEAGLRNAANTSFTVCDPSYWRDAEGMRSLGPN